MKIIAITPPHAVENEVVIIRQLLENSVDIVHLRKHQSEFYEIDVIAYLREILSALTFEECCKIIIHDFPQLYYEFTLKGIHVNKNVTSLPKEYTGYKTRSCHSFEEIIKYKNEYDYLFLSPIFDSISKPDYKSPYTHGMLQKASLEGIIDKKVIALGGVTFDKIPYIQSLNFGGIAMIGELFNNAK
ncbi:MAG: thiamine phosphate synthase [Muribaculaceae bacterium]|nr:thiamine phosphate synthase [Muribaculaceae bacterium]